MRNLEEAADIYRRFVERVRETGKCGLLISFDIKPEHAELAFPGLAVLAEKIRDSVDITPTVVPVVTEVDDAEHVEVVVRRLQGNEG